MVYLLFVLIAIVSMAAVSLFGARKGIIDPGGKLRIYKKCDDDIIPFKLKELILIITIGIAVATVMQISLYKHTSIVNFIKLYGVFLIVASAALVDAKRRIIPNVLIIAGLIFRAGLYLYEIISRAEMKPILINDGIGFLIGFVFLALVSIVSKGSLGFGDVKLFGIIGIVCGAFCTYTTLFFSLIVSVIISVIALATKKMGRKDSFPFGPCIAIGYVIAILLTSY